MTIPQRFVAVTTAAILASIAALGSAPARAAGGLTLAYQSTQTTGAAFAFGPTLTDNAAALWYNPAGLAALEKTQFNLGGSLLYLNYEINARGIFNQLQPSEPDVVPGTTTVDAEDLAAVGDLYFVHPINDELTFGIGLNAPIGFIQNTPVDWSGKYQTTGTFIITQNVGLSLGWAITPDFRLGGGVDIQYIFFNIKNQVDTGTRIETQFDKDCPQIVNSTPSDVLNGLLGGLGSGLTASLGAAGNVLIAGLPADEVICGTGTTPGLIEPMGLAGEFDFDNEFELHDVGFGFNIGFQWDITEATMLGIHFRSKVDHSLSGEAERDNGGNLQYARRLQNEADGAGEQLLLSLREPATGFSEGETYPSLVTLKALQNTNDQNVRAELTIPETINIGLQHNFSPRLKVALNYVWTNWSRFDELEFFYTGQPRFFDDVFRQVIGRELRPNERVDRRDNPTFQPLNFEDAARYGVGADYRWSDTLNVRTGFAYAEPVIDADTTTDRIRAPVDHTYIFTLGATWHMDPQTSIDVAAAYTLISDGAIRQRNIASRTGNMLRGSFSEVHIYALGMTLRHRFE